MSTARNLRTQGYALTSSQLSALAVGLRFATGLCLAIAIGGLLSGRTLPLLALVPIAAVAGWGERHPFDRLWNRFGPQLPPTPRRRRHAFKVATASLLLLALLRATDQELAVLALGGLLVALCATQTATFYCVPSEVLARHERGRTFRADC